MEDRGVGIKGREREGESRGSVKERVGERERERERERARGSSQLPPLTEGVWLRDREEFRRVGVSHTAV